MPRLASEYTTEIGGFEVTISIDRYDEIEHERIEVPEGFDFEPSQLWVNMGTALDTKLVTLEQYLYQRACEQFWSEFDSYKDYAQS